MHEQLLTAALKVFAAAGTRGATTRRIAQEAGVNEVTLFRHFGSKEALIKQAVSSTNDGVVLARLPEHPADPEQRAAGLGARFTISSCSASGRSSGSAWPSSWSIPR